MPTVAYQQFSSGITSGVQNYAQIQAVRKGRIIGVTFDLVGTGGAAAGILNVEVTKNGTAGGTTGPATQSNPPRETGVASSTVLFITTTNHTFQKVITGLDIPLELGDIMFFGSRLVSGTAPSTTYAQVTIYVQE